MTDTQWPRYEVFKQDRPGKSHESVGSVHAVDAEMALQNGRDLFVRRPKCHSLWVVPAAVIFAKTAQELAQDDSWQMGSVSGDLQTYLVFQKQTERRGMTFTTHVGEIAGVSAAHALQNALRKFSGDEVFVWWLVLQTAVTRSQEADIASMFVPPTEKTYRLPNQYRTVFTMQKIKRETGD